VITRPCADRVLDRCGAAREVVVQLGLAAAQVQAVVVAVQGNGVPVRLHPPQQLRPLRDLLPDDEEGRRGAVAGEDLQDRGRALGVGSVVERNGHYRWPAGHRPRHSEISEGAWQAERAGERWVNGCEDVTEHGSVVSLCQFRHITPVPACNGSNLADMPELFDAEVTIRRQRFANEDNGFAVLDAEHDGDEIVLVGALSHLEDRERVHVIGVWVNDSRYGEQVKVSEARPLAPSDSAALVTYLRRIKNIGEKRAQTLVQRFGEQHVLDVIDDEPAAAFRQVGLNPFRAQEAAHSWNELRVTRRLHLLLAPYGLAYLVKRISDEYPSTAHRVVTENPYELTRVFGVGFKVADRIARAGVAGAAGGGRAGSDSVEDVDAIPGRTTAALIYALTEAESRGGNTCLPLPQLLAAAAELLGRAPDEDAVDTLVADGDLMRDGDWIYRTATWELEQELAERIEAMLSTPPTLKPVDPDAAGGGTAGELALTAEQRDGVSAAFAHRLSVITGGPGTGKTATIQTIAAQAKAQDAKVLLVAPTGRAARRMTEASGFEAKTVHSALGWVPGEAPEHDDDNPLPCDLLIVDESSMANLELMVTLMRAVAPGGHVVLVGDADQLAPVGAGKPFADLVASDVVPTARLNHIFRQAAGSMIIQGAHAIRRGEVPEFKPEDGMRQDLFLMERAGAREALELIVELVSERLPKHYGVHPVNDIQVFAPVYRGDLGIDALNKALREALNPNGAPVRGGRLRLGDKLMMTGRNLHDLGLMNGTVLTLIDEVASSGDDDPALVLSSDEQTFRLPPEEIESLRLGYACSVHRGQGIELPVAVIVAHPQSGAFFLRREMLYTAVTRAKLATVIVGSREVIARAARTPDTDRRYSRLGERLAPAV
jgi:exodeoxyribonuclease V alpha subunit